MHGAGTADRRAAPGNRVHAQRRRRVPTIQLSLIVASREQLPPLAQLRRNGDLGGFERVAHEALSHATRKIAAGRPGTWTASWLLRPGGATSVRRSGRPGRADPAAGYRGASLVANQGDVGQRLPQPAAAGHIRVSVSAWGRQKQDQSLPAVSSTYHPCVERRNGAPSETGGGGAVCKDIQAAQGATAGAVGAKVLSGARMFAATCSHRCCRTFAGVAEHLVVSL